jgi:hypothetical protein
VLFASSHTIPASNTARLTIAAVPTFLPFATGSAPGPSAEAAKNLPNLEGFFADDGSGDADMNKGKKKATEISLSPVPALLNTTPSPIPRKTI